jgi:hypothetical protein
MAMIILAQFRGSLWIAILLSANGNPAGRHGQPPAEAKAANKQ